MGCLCTPLLCYTRPSELVALRAHEHPAGRELLELPLPARQERLDFRLHSHHQHRLDPDKMATAIAYEIPLVSIPLEIRSKPRYRFVSALEIA